MIKRIPLEPAAIAVCDAAAKPPLIFELSPKQGREVLEKMQNEPVYEYPAAVSSIQCDTRRWGQIPVWFVRPENVTEIHSIIFYIHGAGWVFGSFHTHEKLVRELAFRTGSLVVFPEYSRAPEAVYPVALEQCYAVMNALPSLVSGIGPNAMRTLTVAGDSAGGNMAIAMTLMAKFRGGIRIHKQLLYYPVTNACFDTCTYQQFAEDYYLYRAGMIWFWKQYAPQKGMREEITASPLRACAEQLAGLPPAMVINGEADVLRDDGEAYAEKLRVAGIDVTAIRIQGIIHDFVMLNALDQTAACRAAMDSSTGWINRWNESLVNQEKS